MKNIAKLMLAALASIALAIPAYAFDFGVSGSMSTTYNITTTTADSSSDAIGSGGFNSDGGAISFSTSHGSGDTSGTLSYAIDYDGDLDETITLSGSTKSGDWTASSSIDYNRGMAGANAGHDKPALTLTDGSATIKMGSAGHIGAAGKGSGGVAGGSVDHNASGFDKAAGAVVGDFQGISYGASFTGGTYTVAYGQETSGSICGAIPDVDSTPSYGATSTGLGVTYETGGIDIAFSFCSGSTASAYDNSSSYGTTGSTMGLGVSMNMGDLTPSFSYGSVSSVGSESEATATGTAMDLTVTMALGDDSAVFQYTSSTGADADNSGSRSGLELGYSTSVGPTTLAVGYGSTSYVNADGVSTVGADGYSMTDIEVNLSYSW